MKETIFNYDNLRDDEITETVVRTKALIINGNKLLIGNEDGCYQYIGGHVEENETLNECLKREILEESGIEIDDSDIKRVFYRITYKNKDYPEAGVNRKTEINYYVIETDKQPDLSKTNYTESEIEQHYTIVELDLNEAIDIIRENIPNHKKNKIIAPEMIEALEEYLKQISE